MPFDSDVVDVALLGTGVAPLVAANHFLAQGHSVLLLNPDRDFFLEDSELPLDPLLPSSEPEDRLAYHLPENAIAELQPSFPGAVEFWSGHNNGGEGESKDFHDHSAPHVRQRGRLWLRAGSELGEIEDLYVQASDRGLNPQILEGVQAAARFPGLSLGRGDYRGLWIPKSCDVDVSRYRNGLLEFIRERMGSSHMICSANQIELMPEGVRYHAQGVPRTARLTYGMLVFWTPRLTSWVLAQAKRTEVTPVSPKGVRFWEQWSLISRETLDPRAIGVFGDMIVWAEAEGSPSVGHPVLNRLAVLRGGPLVGGGESWFSSESFNALSELCHDLLKWDHFSIRSMRPRALFEWDDRSSWSLLREGPWVRVINACDGPLVDVVRQARAACEEVELRLGA